VNPINWKLVKELLFDWSPILLFLKVCSTDLQKYKTAKINLTSMSNT